ncbi:kinesin-like protein KIF13A isoform X2 [Spodoptera frugiperda]|uniref:Kinesin-like protein KIF13A isoform X2 n=1 Tax=Spodoptera frugiperda TaxID=7108 RepID=A0A9R0EZG5_SPOFR|nr:kinesin-like protein KIF13A isoform X2 [Spodoptera frugiperda]
MATDKIKVAVRVRPFNRRELELGTQCVVEMENQQTILQIPQSAHEKERKQPKTFAFDHCFYSLDPSLPHFASQKTVFECLGRDILDNAFDGYNACIFAYGQTGSGKSYTMMGSPGADEGGIIPRLCDSLFERIKVQQSPPALTYKVEVSYMEIYNERVHDLLDPETTRRSLRVREHAVLGPYVDGLSQLAVTSFQDIDNLMTEGNKSRTVAATNMNSESSRSHAVFSVVLTQTLTDAATGVSGEKVARLSLVDLAGSERAVKTGAVGDRLKEGSNINKSLTTLGLVISKLADQSSGTKNKDKFVPYRDSVLTWLLKDNLGGNSKTVMVATISPAADNYEETLSTLRYADRAKRIVNHAVVNEDPNARIIRELRQEVETLKEMLKYATVSGTGSPVGEEVHEKLAQSEHLMKEMSRTWEEKLVETGRIQSERQQALEKMGISVQASGIKVEKNKYYLVNLNADPSLNELLVYYLKDRTLVGGSSSADIQLSGLGIQPEHCLLLVEGGGLHMEPLGAARCFVNGTPVVSRVRLGHADRILWGNHHFFRVNCPKATEQDSGYSTATASEPQTPAQPIDYNFARDEIMLNELSNDPIQTAISRLEKQHEEDKQVALEKQRQEYERQFQQLRNILSPSTPYPPYAYDPLKLGKMTACTPTTAARVERWAAERDDTFKRSLGRLKADILRANALVQEANFLAEEMRRNTRFSVTLQIPPQNLSPNRKRGAFVSEPAIMVKRPGRSGQVWSMEKLDNKLVDMRDMYDDWRRRQLRGDADIEEVRLPSGDGEQTETALDPFYESQENHNLIGVANVFLEALFHDVTLDYHTPIISQQGEVAGRLQVEISRVAGQFPQDRICEAASDSSGDMRDDDDPADTATQQVTIRVSIKQATGLPPSLSHFVFCQYSLGAGEPVVVPPVVSADTPPAAPQAPPLSPRHQSLVTFRFDHKKDFTIPLTEEFIEHCAEGALSIEVWGHRSAGFSRARGNWEVEQQQLAKARSLADRWTELTRKIELWVEIHELNDNGEYAPVEVVQRNDVWTGGVYQVRQGQQRRIAVRVRPALNSGTLPLVCQQILSIEVGSVSVRSRLQMPLDSYQDEDLAVLRERWSDALFRRRQHLHAQLQKLVNMSPSMKSERDNEREQSLVEQWVSLTEERNAVLVPSPGSPIPGAPAAWVPPLGMEHHIPVLFLDLNADDLTTHPSGEEVTVAGLHSILPKEHGNKFYELQILHHHDKDVSAVASWDSSIHDSQYLNRITEANERVYLILKTTVRLSHPAPMDLILRKRLGLNIYKRQSLTDRIRKKIVSYYVDRTDQLTHTGVTYEVVSNIPKASEELEERESLAQIAATGEEASAADGETYIEKYTRGVSAVESILTLDRLRQSVAVKELEQARGQPITMRKTASVPNFSQLSQALEHAAKNGNNLMRLDSSFESLAGLTSGRAGSMADLAEDTPRRSVHRHSYAAPSHNDPEIPTPTKPFGLGSFLSARPTFLNLNLNLNSLRLQTPNKSSPASGKLGLRMTTLHEEPGRRNDEDSHSEPESAPVDELTTPRSHRTRNRATSRGFLPTSKTLDSLHELACERAPNKNSPSISSSGYGSQAVSSTNLTNDDTLSIRSMSVDETPDFDKTMDYTHISRTKNSMAGLRNEITELRNDINDLKNDIVESKHELDDSMFEKAKTPVLTPGSRNRINPFLRDCEDAVKDESKNTMVDPLGALPVESAVLSSSKSVDNTQVNGDVSHEPPNDISHDTSQDTSHDTSFGEAEVESVSSEQSSHDAERSREASSVGESDSASTGPDQPVVKTQLPAGKVVRRRAGGSARNASRASFPSGRPRSAHEPGLHHTPASSTERIGDDDSSECPVLQPWMCVGESVQLRLSSSTGVIAYAGPTHFAGGTWIGIELDAPTGKNDGSVGGQRYFECRPRHGIFVRPDKIVHDRRGRSARAFRDNELKRAQSKEGLHNLHRSRSRGDSINAVGTKTRVSK